jgi:mRNA interferase RelE/StbE
VSKRKKKGETSRPPGPPRTYKVELDEKHALRPIEDIDDKGFKGKVFDTIRGLATNPRPTGCKKLKGKDAWRIRVGDWRVVYTIDDDKVYVLVVAAGDRSSIYGLIEKLLR